MARRGNQARPSSRSVYSGNRVGTIPLGRRATVGGSHRGEYARPPRGPGPGQGPYRWKEPPPLDAIDFSGSDGWVQCAADSHLAAIRFVHGMDHGVLSLDADGPDYAYSLDEDKMFAFPDKSFLQVKFRDGGWAAYWSEPGTEFTAERLEAIYLMMESDTSPGEIIWRSLIGSGGSVAWPYDTSATGRYRPRTLERVDRQHEEWMRNHPDDY